MNRTWLRVESVSKHFDGVTALDNFSCSLDRGEVLGVIGPNGAGKTTLFNVITGFVPADGGRVLFRGAELGTKPPHKIAKLGIARTFQDLRLIYRLTVLQHLLLTFRGQLGEHLCNVFLRWRITNRREKENTEAALAILEETGLLEKPNDFVAQLSYGQQKLLSLACCMATGADLLLLDEPVAGIAPEMIDKILSIIGDLPDQGRSVIMIEHNIDAVAEVCDRVVFMDGGANISEGTPEQVRRDPKVVEAYLQ